MDPLPNPIIGVLKLNVMRIFSSDYHSTGKGSMIKKLRSPNLGDFGHKLYNGPHQINNLDKNTMEPVQLQESVDEALHFNTAVWSAERSLRNKMAVLQQTKLIRERGHSNDLHVWEKNRVHQINGLNH